MTITFTPAVVTEHDIGALLGTFENSNNINAQIDFYFEKPTIFKINGNQLFLEDTWHYNFEDQIFYDYTNGVTLAYSQESLVQWPFKDSEDASQWINADISVFADLNEFTVTPVAFSSMETGARVATISTDTKATSFQLTENPFVSIVGYDIKLLDNMYYDLNSTNFHSGSSYWDPGASTGQVMISSSQDGMVNEKQFYDYSTFLQNIVSGAQASSVLSFTSVTAEEHKNGALLGTFAHASDSGGTYSFANSKPDMLKIVGNQLLLEENYHYDFETSSFYSYTQDESGSTSWAYFGPYNQDALSWRIKYTAVSGGEAFVDADISFSDIDEAVTITPVAFNSLEAGATVATISKVSNGDDQIELAANDFFVVEGNNVKLTETYYFNLETGMFHSGESFFDPTIASGQLSLISKQSGPGTINYFEGLDYSSFIQSIISLAQHSPLTYYASGGTDSKQKAGSNAIDALLYDDVFVHRNDSYYAANLTGLANDTTVITYSFSALDGTQAKYITGYDEGSAQVTGLNSQQKEAVRKALLEWEKVANIKFHEVEETGDLVGTIRFAFTDLSSADTDGFWGWARSPGQSTKSGDIWISADNLTGSNWDQGTSYNFMSLLHEIGHSLGLAHPFAETDSGSTDILPTSEDFRNYTVMSYTDPENSSTYSQASEYQYLISSTPMVYDIAAVQHLYGPSENNVGVTTFSYDPGQPFVEAIWDSSGTDTLDLSNFVEACSISLVPGTYSTIVCNGWTMVDNLGIAHGTIIENVIGGNGNDTILGNETDNQINGGNGNDILTGGLGLDHFNFSANFGTDTVTDFSLTQDTLTFIDESGVEIASALVTETFNDAGDVVLTVPNGSSVTLTGISSYNFFSPLLSGNIVSNFDVALENVNVKGYHSDGTEVGSGLTDASGNFSFNASSDLTLVIEKDYTSEGSITVRDALDALKLSIGLPKTDGTSSALDFIAADMNGDGEVSVRDALEILRYSIGLESSPAHWKFVENNIDTSTLSRSNVIFDNNISVNFSDIQSTQGFLGILVGDVDGSFVA